MGGHYRKLCYLYQVSTFVRLILMGPSNVEEMVSLLESEFHPRSKFGIRVPSACFRVPSAFHPRSIRVLPRSIRVLPLYQDGLALPGRVGFARMGWLCQDGLALPEWVGFARTGWLCQDGLALPGQVGFATPS